MFVPKIAYRICVVRHIAQLSWLDLAGRLQTSRSQLSRMEPGLADYMGVGRRRRIGEAAGVRPF